MTDTPAELLQQYFDNWHDGNGERATELWADDVVMHYPGRNRFSGKYEGRQSILNYLEEIDRRGGSDVIEIYTVMGNETNAAASYREDLQWGENTHELYRFNNYRFENGKVVEIWVYEADQHAVDEFFKRYA